MNETDWLTAREPEPMLEWLRQQGKLTERKARLFAVACCRRVWRRINEKFLRRTVEVAENYADGAASWGKNCGAWSVAARYFNSFQRKAEGVPVLMMNREALAGRLAMMTAGGSPASGELVDAAVELAGEDVSIFCDILRDICNPFHSAPLGEAWLTDEVVHLARASYDERSLPSGVLDSVRLAILADSLEEVGCNDTSLLNHLRSSGVHVRGCWALDAILLGKE